MTTQRTSKTWAQRWKSFVETVVLILIGLVFLAFVGCCIALDKFRWTL
jgi:hypothetical protein